LAAAVLIVCPNGYLGHACANGSSKFSNMCTIANSAIVALLVNVTVPHYNVSLTGLPSLSLEPISQSVKHCQCAVLELTWTPGRSDPLSFSVGLLEKAVDMGLKWLSFGPHS